MAASTGLSLALRALSKISSSLTDAASLAVAELTLVSGIGFIEVDAGVEFATCDWYNTPRKLDQKIAANKIE